jgi:uncharacterized protein (TIGR03083 family)
MGLNWPKRNPFPYRQRPVMVLQGEQDGELLAESRDLPGNGFEASHVRATCSKWGCLETDYRADVTNDELFLAVVTQRRRLIEMVEGFTDNDWNTDSLCEGWRVRDVVGHLVSILEIPLGRFMLNVVKARGFDRYADVVAREIGARDLRRLLANYRSLSDSRFAPPVVGPIAPLSDVFVHTRDIERPLGRSVSLDPIGQRAVLDYFCGGRAYGFIPPSRTKGLRFEATDMTWSIGTGPVVSGTAEALMMSVAGRHAALPDVSGPGVSILQERIT